MVNVHTRYKIHKYKFHFNVNPHTQLIFLWDTSNKNLVTLVTKAERELIHATVKKYLCKYMKKYFDKLYV
jgi:hypothetical protein